MVADTNEGPSAKSADQDTYTHVAYTNAYIDILSSYKTHIEASTIKKNNLKENFLKIISRILYAVVSFFVLSVLAAFILFIVMAALDYQSVTVVTGAVTAVLSSFSTLIVSILNLPRIIADYLFDKEEDKLMGDIIKNIQRYELSAVGLEHEKADNIDILRSHKLNVEDDVDDNEPNKTEVQVEPSDASDSLDVDAVGHGDS